jgi:uncharacterized damage-inducible protein DinB
MLALVFYQDFLRFHRWGNGKLRELSNGLSQDALDASMPLGPGSLRATLIHNIAAQRVWLDRWQNYATPRFPSGESWSLERIHEEQSAVDNELTRFVDSQTDESLKTSIAYQNLKGEPFQHRLGDLLLHVLNHAVHHRAQSLHFLKRHDRVIPGGLDYLFFKLAHPTLLLDPDVAKGCRAYGLEVGFTEEVYQLPSIDTIRQYQSYTDWATLRLLRQAMALETEQLDRDFKMGHGTFRKNVLHLYDAECWWQKNWSDEPAPFPKSPIDMPIDELIYKWQAMAAKRSQLVDTTGQSGLAKTVHGDFGGGPLHFRFSESMIQLCVHGTLHRAQANNMLRNLGVNVLPLDYIIYLRENS